MNRIITLKNKYFFFDKFIEYAFNFLSICLRYINKTRARDSSKILIVSLHRLGDTVFTIPAVRHLLQHFHANKIIIFTFPETKCIYESGDIHSEYIILENRNVYFGKNDSISYIKKESYDIIIDLTGSILSASIIMRLKAKKYYGISRKYYRFLYDEWCLIRTIPHLMDIYLDLLREKLSIKIDDNLKEFPVKFDFDKPIIIQPNAGWEAKEWGLSKFIKLYELLIKYYNCKLVFPDNYLTNEFIEELKSNKIEFIVTENVSKLIKEIEFCSLFIGNDSGPLNIATFLGKPTFCIYGPTNPYFHIPYNKNHDFIQKILPCSPAENEKYCFTDAGCNGCPSNECMSLLSVKEVFDKIMMFLDRIGFKANIAADSNYENKKNREKIL